LFLDLVLSILATLTGAAAYGFAALVLFTAGIGGPFSQDMLLMAAADFTRAGALQPLPLMFVAWVGIMAGDLLTFWTGHHYGSRWIRRPWAARLVRPENLPALEAGVNRIGTLFAFVTRFLPGQRTTLFFIAGTLRMPYHQFLVGNGLAAIAQVVLFVFGVRSLGWQWQALRAPFDRADDVLTATLTVLLLGAWLVARRRRRRARR
jgi:membrane protein DedA with SNARE-associated domain